ncbi:hypothetical protein HanIR_Chr14g0723521 [Helianthus annuus]|nr:hypothetical protein HanIR_Chr14g0723521 [Helianthus annuus]
MIEISFRGKISRRHKGNILHLLTFFSSHAMHMSIPLSFQNIYNFFIRYFKKKSP